MPHRFFFRGRWQIQSADSGDSSLRICRWSISNQTKEYSFRRWRFLFPYPRSVRLPLQVRQQFVTHQSHAQSNLSLCSPQRFLHCSWHAAYVASSGINPFGRRCNANSIQPYNCSAGTLCIQVWINQGGSYNPTGNLRHPESEGIACSGCSPATLSSP